MILVALECRTCRKAEGSIGLAGPLLVLRLGLETELRTEREHRQSLQKALQQEQDNSTELRTQLQQLQGLQAVSVTPTDQG